MIDIAEARARQDAARVIQTVRDSYAADYDRAAFIEDVSMRHATQQRFAWMTRELDRAATIALTGQDPGDAGTHTE